MREIQTRNMAVRFGIDELLVSAPIWKKQRIGLITNEAARTCHGVQSRKALQDAGFNIVTLFSPEHGLDVTGADGVAVADGIDTLTQLPIVSLYGTKLAPDQDDLLNIDLLVFDVPDTGVRFYTYLWTLSYALEACARSKKKIIVLDRPNPISGNLTLVEGPFLEEPCASFIGRWNMPVRHSCTLGELAQYFNEQQNIQADLAIILCKDWDRTMFQPNWGTPFVPTSPAIQSYQSMLLYPGLCFLEATNLNEGRGTEFAFQQIGAPWLNNTALCSTINNLMDGDIKATAVQYTPTANHFKGEKCKGIRFEVKDPEAFKPVFFGLILLKLIKDMHPNYFAWDVYKTNVNATGANHLDKLTGMLNSEGFFEFPFANFLQKITIATARNSWEKTIQPYLLY